MLASVACPYSASYMKEICAAEQNSVIADYNEPIGQELSRPDRAEKRVLIFVSGLDSCCPLLGARRKGGIPSN